MLHTDGKNTAGEKQIVSLENIYHKMFSMLEGYKKGTCEKPNITAFNIEQGKYTYLDGTKTLNTTNYTTPIQAMRNAEQLPTAVIQQLPTAVIQNNIANQPMHSICNPGSPTNLIGDRKLEVNMEGYGTVIVNTPDGVITIYSDRTGKYITVHTGNKLTASLNIHNKEE